MTAEQWIVLSFAALLIGTICASSAMAAVTHRLEQREHARRLTSPYTCDGCFHHSSYHRSSSGCHHKERCGCQRFVSTQPEVHKALIEMEDER